MRDFVTKWCTIRSTLSTAEEAAFLAELEIKRRGYALFAYRIPLSPLVMASTKGLEDSGHAEIATLAGSEDEAFGLLKYLAEQVLDHGRHFTEGTSGTAFFGELKFHDLSAEAYLLDAFEDFDDFEDPEDFDDLDDFDDALGEYRPRLLVCESPSRRSRPARKALHQVQRKAA